MNKLKNIIAGWWYWFQSSPRIKAKAAERMNICRACPHKKGAFCGLCGCVLIAKTASPEETCPELRWGKMKVAEKQPEIKPKTTDEAIEQAKSRGQSSLTTMPNSEEYVEKLRKRGFLVKQVRDEQKPNCKEGCVDNYDVIYWMTI